ncbi:ribbon-helix-helix protein, CopG family [Rhizobacter sp. SG703]|uniref:ribbon-helix-helix protein, CopG family n=1 Tax=Rhizobacter sp. SG703 TaxID=2587140 RepID=UPI0017D2721B|nr:ribbon-helix-helix protein, CopG family [Rhizobacter sp. SG703]NKI93497.1 hypothetical protein [Rhizobacter sp. SG703]
MAVTKTEVVSIRVPPDVKAALVAAAEKERRSLATMVEVMVLEYCKAHGVVQGRTGIAQSPRRIRGERKSVA